MATTLSVVPGTRYTERDHSYDYMQFTVSLSDPAPASGIAVDYRTYDGTATDGLDYAGASGTLRIAAGSTTDTISIAIYGDILDETDESLYLELSNPVGAELDGGGPVLRATGVILDNDGLGSNLALAVSSPVVLEGSSGINTAHVDVELSTAPTTTITIPFQTVNGTAVAGQDYTAVTGSVTFLPGQTVAGVDIPIGTDSVLEPTESFSVVFTPPAAVASGTQGSSALVTILDDDASAGSLPVISVGNARYVERDSSYDYLQFVVTLSAPATSGGVTVAYRTFDGTATDGSDYGSGSGTLRIAAGDSTGTISVAIYGDIADEVDESLYIELSNPTGAVLAGSAPVLRATGTILDNDGLGANVALILSNPIVTEGNSGTAVAHVEASLSRPLGVATTIPYRTVAGSAAAGSDYTAVSGSLTFLAGQTVAAVDVPIVGDTVSEPTESFSLLFSPPGSVASGPTGASSTITILDDDAAGGSLPVASVGNAAYVERDSSYDYMQFGVTLSAPAPSGGVSIAYRTTDGSAIGGTDYATASGTLRISAGQTTGTINVAIYGDATDEVDEKLLLDLSGPVGAVFAGGVPTAEAVGTILDNDGLGSNLSVIAANATVQEGDTGTKVMHFEVSLSRAVATAVVIPYQTTSGTATAGTDFVAATGSLTFLPGQTLADVDVTINGDYAVEPSETVNLLLSASISGPATAATSVVGTITNDDLRTTVNGSSRDDVLQDGPANQLFIGGAGHDVLTIQEGRRGDLFLGNANGDVDIVHRLQVDTIRGIEEVTFIDGRMVYDNTDPIAQVARLYKAALAREPDQDGLNAWTAAVKGGMPLVTVAGSFAASAEFVSKYGALDNAGYVTLLYNNVLGRAPDSAGLNSWVGAINSGSMTRAQVLVGFSESAEFKTNTAYQLATGLWDRSENAAEVARLYDTVLGRKPDAVGLSGWTSQLDGHALTINQVTDSFVSSSEFLSVYGPLNNHDFVETLYEHSLHRSGDAAGLNGWTTQLNSGAITRSAVVLKFSESAEHISNTASDIASNDPTKYGILLAS